MKTALMIAFIFMSRPYNIELAITPTEQATGLMYRRVWTDDSQGMLFINEHPRGVSFWMRNTYLELSLFYLDERMNILEINRPAPLDESGVNSTSHFVKYVLELNPALEREVLANWSLFTNLMSDALRDKESEIYKLQSGVIN